MSSLDEQLVRQLLPRPLAGLEQRKHNLKNVKRFLTKKKGLRFAQSL